MSKRIDLRKIGEDVFSLDQRFAKLGFTSIGLITLIIAFGADEKREIDDEFMRAYTRIINAVIADVVAGRLVGYDPETLLPMDMFSLEDEDGPTYDHTTLVGIEKSKEWAEQRGISVLFEPDAIELVKAEMNPDRSHVSDNLTLLNQAARKFWSNAERDDPTTQHSNAEVAAWLIEKGMTSTMANNAASIIRPAWAHNGRKPEK